MPSTMIHLAVARAVRPEGSAHFWVGSFAPDHTNDREKKDRIHLRGVADHWAQLDALYRSLDKKNDFEMGWLAHLFTDACWDEAEAVEHRAWFTAAQPADEWFRSYREEIGRVTYGMFHRLPWAAAIWDAIEGARLEGVRTTLPITREENEWYRDRVAKKHRGSDPTQVPQFFTEERVAAFVESTKRKLLAYGWER